MPGIPREVTEHALKIRLGSKPVKQRLRRFDKQKRMAIGEVIARLLAAEFIRELYHQVSSQSRSCTKEKREMEDVC
jgi:hypothetical protein